MPCRPVVPGGQTRSHAHSPQRARFALLPGCDGRALVGRALAIIIFCAAALAWTPPAAAAAAPPRTQSPERDGSGPAGDPGVDPSSGAPEAPPEETAAPAAPKSEPAPSGDDDGDEAADDDALPVPKEPPPPQTISPFPPSPSAKEGGAAMPTPRPHPAKRPTEPTEPTEPELPEPKPEANAPKAAPVPIRKRNVPPFWFDITYDTHRTRALAFPPLFVDRRPAKGKRDNMFHADLSLTFGWKVKDTDKRRWLSPGALFFGTFSARKTVWGAGALLMGYKRVGEQFNFGQFPLVWWWGNRHVRNFLVVPFHYQQKTPDSFKAISALLFWYGHENLKDTDPLNDRKHFVAAPIFWRFQRGLRRFDIGAPLYLGGENELEGLEHATLLPFFHWQSREFGNATDLWTPFWIQRKDRARRKRAWAIPPLLTFQHHTADRTLTMATPLAWHHRNHLTGGRTTVAGPLVLHRDPRQDFQLLPPLFWRFADRERGVSTLGIAPLLLARKTPTRTRVWTLLGGGMRGKDGAWGLGLPPLLTFARHDPKGRSFAGALGLFWYVHDHPKRRRGLFLGPLAFGVRDPAGTRLGLPPLLTFAGRKGKRSWQVVTPMFWHLRDRQEKNPTDTWVVPPAYVRRNRTGFEAGLAPLLFFGKDARRSYAVAPLLLFGHHRNKDTGESLTLFPLFVRSVGPEHRAFAVPPLVWDVAHRSGERHTVVLPAYYRRHMGDVTWHITPLGGARRGKDSLGWMAGPIYGVRGPKRRSLGVAPLFFYDRRTDKRGTRTHAVIPGLLLHRRTPDDDMDVITPLVWWRRVRGERPRTGLAVVPLYFRQRQPGGVDVDAGLGFFYSRDRARHTHTLIAGPAFHRLSRQSLEAGVFPLYWWHDDEKKRRLVGLPAIFHFEDKLRGSHTTLAPPLWFDRQRANGRRTWAAFPFAFGGKRLHNHTRVGLAAAGYVDIFRLRRNYRFVGVVPFLFRYQKCGFQAKDDPKCTYTVWGSFPFFLHGKDGKGRRTHGALGLYYFDRTPKGFRLYTLPFGVRYEPGEILSYYALTFGVKTTRTHTRSMFLPLFFHKKHRKHDESTTLVLPPLYIGQHKKDRRWFQAGLLVWQFRQQHQVTTAVLPPIFLYRHAHAERKLSWLLPVYLRDDNIGKDEAWTAVFPALYVQRRHGKDLDVVQFPLVWHIERGENHGTFGAFVWWDIAHEGKRFQMVPGLYTRFASHTGDTRIVGPLLGWWTKGRGSHEGDLHWRVLLGLFGGGVEDGVRYVSIFGARIKRDGKARARRQARRRARRDARLARRRARQGARLARRRARQGARLARRGARPTARRRTGSRAPLAGIGH